jgi:hypothetical protein
VVQVDRQELLARLRQQVVEQHEAVYASAGDAFAHVAVREYFDLDDEEALEYCDVGGSRDKGVDAFWVDEDDRRAVLVQAKWASEPKNFSARAVQETEAAYRWLVRLGKGQGGSAAPRVVDAARTLARLRETEPDFPVHVFLIVAGDLTKGGREEEAKLIDDFSDEPAEFVVVTLDDLLAEYDERLNRESGVDAVHPEHTFTLRDDGFFEHHDEPQALVATLSGAELAEAAQKWGYRLFMRNLRYLLPGRSRGSVNAGIRRTLETPEGRQHFWYYNNGIAIVCDAYELDREALSVTIKNMQIVNGAQTTATLNHALDELQAEPVTSLLARIIAEPEEELRQNITFYNNRQNAVKARDLQSNDPVQDRLHREFLRRRRPWFYERKRGEWNALSARDADLKKKVGNRRVDNERAAQAAYAFYFDPGKARADKKNLFQPKRDGGYYEDIFSDSRTTAQFLLPYLIAEHIRAEKNRYLRSIRDIDPDRVSMTQRRLLSRQWVKFADQFLLGTISFYIEMRGGHDDKRLEELLAGDYQGMMAGAYHAAVRDLHSLFTRQERQAADTKKVFSVANYVKGNWDQAFIHLFAEWDAREAVGDPLDGVQLLSEDAREA